jgi:hypothetical protein
MSIILYGGKFGDGSAAVRRISLVGSFAWASASPVLEGDATARVVMCRIDPLQIIDAATVPVL